MNGHETWLELVALHALGALDPEERARLEGHLAEGCETCEGDLARALRVAEELLIAVPPVPLIPGARERLLSRVRADAAAAPRRNLAPARRRVWVPIAAAASLALAVGLGLYARTLRGVIDQERAARRDLEGTLLAERRTREDLQAQASRLEQAVSALTAPGTRAVTLAGLGPAPGASARAFLDPEKRQLLLFVDHLPPLPAGRTYQLWVIAGKQPPVSAGTFDVRPDGTARFDARAIPPLAGSVTVAVTEEPAGGVPQPTGPMVLAGS